MHTIKDHCQYLNESLKKEEMIDREYFSTSVENLIKQFKKNYKTEKNKKAALIKLWDCVMNRCQETINEFKNSLYEIK